MTTGAPEDLLFPVARLKVIINWFAPFALFFGTFAAAGAVRFDDFGLGLTSAILFGYLAVLLIARITIGRRKVKLAIGLMSGGLIIAALLASLIQPFDYPFLALIPILAVALALPYLTSATTKQLSAAGWFATLLIVAIGLASPRERIAPEWFSAMFEIWAFSAAVGLIYLVLWQFSSEMRGNLRQMSSNNLELRDARDRLQELDRMKTQFLNNAAHELSTPLTPIRLQLHLLRRGHKGVLARNEGRSLEIVERNIDRLGHIVKDVLDVARLQAGRLSLHLTRIPIARAIQESVESFVGSAKIARIKLEAEVEPGLELEADENRLSQVVFNLVGNALRFTPSGGRVTVVARRQGDEVLLEVRDTGEGLTADQIARLFLPFSQVHDTMQKTESGVGLGLYISRGIVEAHGGRMWAESPGPNRGATFSIALPMQSQPAPPIAPKHPVF